MLLLKIIAPGLVLIIAFVRLGLQEKWHDRRTKKHNLVLRVLIYLMVAATLITSLIVWQDATESSVLKSQISDLVDGKDKLLRLIGNYQADLTQKQTTIKELEKKVKETSRGVTAVYYYNGAVRRTDGPNVTIDDSLVPVSRRMFQLQQAGDFRELTSLCQVHIKSNPRWPTPYIFLGAAAAASGDVDRAIESFQKFIQDAPIDPSYGYGKARNEAQRLLNLLQVKKKDG
jgi:tetratricopeptide (TPR) repeat protein